MVQESIKSQIKLFSESSQNLNSVDNAETTNAEAINDVVARDNIVKFKRKRKLVPRKKRYYQPIISRGWTEREE